MKVYPIYNTNLYNTNKDNSIRQNRVLNAQIPMYHESGVSDKNSSVNFTGNPFAPVADYLQFLKALKAARFIERYLQNHPNGEQMLFRNLRMETLEGIQYGIEVFKGLSMKDIQFLSENLHVIAVKRGCNNMCGHCYADAKPSNREMSWEDFTLITRGFKKLRKRLGKLPLFGENIDITKDDKLFQTTELFYDADCMNIAIKDKKGKVHDMRELITEVYESMGRKSCFDTAGWNPNNAFMQKRAEEYAEYFSKPENMEKLNAFNLSFNVFNASYIASVKALKAKDFEKANMLRNKFTDRIANALFTFTPLFEHKDFGVIIRSFEKAKHFGGMDMLNLLAEVLTKLQRLYETDLSHSQKYIKIPEDIKKYMDLAIEKTGHIYIHDLNAAGRMKQFMRDFKIKEKIPEYDKSVDGIYYYMQRDGRHHKIIGHRFVDTDGRVYFMNYAMFFPTEIRLNLKNQAPTPPLANLKEECLLTKEIINRKELPGKWSDYI